VRIVSPRSLAAWLALTRFAFSVAPDALAGTTYSLGEVQAFSLAASTPEVTAGAAQGEPARGGEPGLGSDGPTAVDERARAEEALTRSPWAILPHRPNYILPFSYNSSPNNEPYQEVDPGMTGFDNAEAKFQISFKIPVWERMFGSAADLYVAYTQISLWQVYNTEMSSPFRDTNYEPEAVVFLRTDNTILGLRNRQIAFGAVHQSNGRGLDALSRSWNRLYVAAVFERGNFVCSLKPWWRIPEKEEDDDNPDIEDYLGYGEFRAAYKRGENVLSLMLRDNLRTGHNRGAIELDWSFPLQGKLKGLVQYFNGYGESLLDYNHANQRIGVGVMLSDVL